MKKTLFIFTIALFVCQSLKAQLPGMETIGQKDAENIKRNTLVVILLTEDKKYLKKLNRKNPEEAEKYKNQIQSYNKDIQVLVLKMLQISKSVQYKSLADIEVMTFEERANCTFMLLGYYSPKFNDLNKMPRINFHCKKGPQKSIKTFYKTEALFNGKIKYYLRWEFYNLNEKGKASQLVFYKNLPNKFVSQADITYGLNQTELKFEGLSKKTKGLNPRLLKEKTLLINKDNLDEKTTETEITKCYPYKYAIVSKEEFERAIVEKNPKYCNMLVVPIYIAPAPMGPVVIYNIIYGHEIIDSSDGVPVDILMASLNFGGFSKSHYKITAEDFVELTKRVN